MGSSDSNSIAISSQILELFSKQRSDMDIASHPTLNKFRDEGAADITESGIPDQKVEDYKYSDVSKLFKSSFATIPTYLQLKADLHSLFTCSVTTMETHLALTINGWFYRDNREIGSLPKGVIICSMIEACDKHSDIIEKHIGAASKDSNDPILSLNKMFATDGIFVYIPKGVVLERPIQIINLLGSKSSVYATQRNLIVADNFSESKILICDHTLSEKSNIINSLTEISVCDGAKVELFNVENQNNLASTLSSIYSRQEKDSKFSSHTVTLHGGFIRNNLKVILDGENAETEIYGVSVTDSYQHVDNFTNIVHAKPNCRSNQVYKNILEDNSTGSFTGQIVVKEGAHGSSADQKNNNILLSTRARINTKPQLIIDNDDVKCSHGATVGQMDKDAIFYLQSRGIGKVEARLMLTAAFALEILNKISIPSLRETIDNLIEKRLRGESSHCEGCLISCNKNK